MPEYSISKSSNNPIQSFSSMFYRQYFSLPESIVFYMSKNVSSPTVYHNLIKCCKYFYQKNQILFLHCLFYCGDSDAWYTCTKIGEKCCTSKNGENCLGKFFDNQIKLELDSFSQKIVVTNVVQISRVFSFNVSPLILPRNLCFKSVQLKIRHQILTLNQLKSMCFSAKKIDFYNVTVINEENERKVSVSKIIQCCPNLEEFCFYGKSDSSNITSSTVKELLEIPHFSKIKIFELKNISQLFDIETLYDSFLKENKTMGIHLDFARNISINYKKTLEKITDKILTSKTNGFWPPKITANFNQKEDEMNSAHFQYSKNCSCHRYI